MLSLTDFKPINASIDIDTIGAEYTQHCHINIVQNP
jgi:hypothetical protein